MSRSVWKFTAGLAMALGGVLVVLGVFLLIRGFLESGLVGALYALIYVVTIAILAVPPVILGGITWRRANTRPS